MLKKTSYEETGPESVELSSNGNPTIVKADAIEAAENEDMPLAQPKHTSVFGSTLVFKGELSADEEILIEGTVEGTIAHHSKNVIIGKQGRVSALIHANSITIHGRVDGDIHGDVMVVLTDGCEVSGKIFCPRIVMEDGAKFDGTIQMK
jgi:cytoskeletal protein CcmA (bactofilin family)